MNQPLAALASPVPSLTTAQLRHTQSGLDTFPAQRVAWLLPVRVIDERARPAIVLNERARGALPKEPQFHRALNDDMLVDVLQQIALRLSHGLRQTPPHFNIGCRDPIRRNVMPVAKWEAAACAIIAAGLGRMVKTPIYTIIPFLCAANAFGASAANPAVLARGPATHAYLLFLTEIDHHFDELRAARSSMRSALRRATAHPQEDTVAAPLNRLLRSSAAECTAVGVLLASGTQLVPTGTMLADADNAYFERTEMAAEEVACDERVLAVDLEAHLQFPGNSTADESVDNRKLMNDESAYFRSIGETLRHFGYTQAAGMRMLRSRGLLRSPL